MKILNAIWFSSLEKHYGIIMGEVEETGERKAYLGVAETSDLKYDTEHIAYWGAPFTFAAILIIAKHFAEEKLKEGMTHD